MSRQSVLLLLCFALTLLVARMDRDVDSFASLVRWENVPALVIYTVLFRLIVLGATSSARAIIRHSERSQAR